MPKLLKLLAQSNCSIDCATKEGTTNNDMNRIDCVAQVMVDQILCTIHGLIAKDPGGLYLYKRPRLEEARYSRPSHIHGAGLAAAQSAFSAVSTMISGFGATAPAVPSDPQANWIPMSQAGEKTDQPAVVDWDDSDTNSSTFSSDDSDNGDDVRSDDHYRRRLYEQIDWPTIGEFVLWQAVQQIREYILLWRLTPSTQFELISSEQDINSEPPFGERYEVEAHFSKPTPACPNPLAISKIYFTITVSQLLPDDYPIMVTYRFEGFRSRFYALGSRCIRSLRFQRFFLDTILQSKMDFYTEIGERRHLQPTTIHSRRTLATRETIHLVNDYPGMSGNGNDYTDNDTAYSKWIHEKATRKNDDFFA